MGNNISDAKESKDLVIVYTYEYIDIDINVLFSTAYNIGITIHQMTLKHQRNQKQQNRRKANSKIKPNFQ